MVGRLHRPDLLREDVPSSGSRWVNHSRRILSGLLTGVIAAAIASPASAQNGVYQPLSQATPPGVAARWAGIQGKARGRSFQPVRIHLPSRGNVTLYAGSPQRAVLLPAPAQAGVMVGGVYRLKLSRMPEFPGIELYPSIEIIDRLHPPAGMAERFPVPVEFTEEEIDLVLSGRMVTKVIYLEQPQLAGEEELTHPMRVRTISPRRNLLTAADRLGRPLVIIRLGGRLPDIHGRDTGFYGNGGPITLPKTKTLKRENR